MNWSYFSCVDLGHIWWKIVVSVVTANAGERAGEMGMNYLEY